MAENLGTKQTPWAMVYKPALEALRLKLITRTDLAVYTVLCSHAWSEDKSWVLERKDIGEEVGGLSDSKVTQSTKRLASLGLIEIFERRNGRSRLPNRYFICDKIDTSLWPETGGVVSYRARGHVTEVRREFLKGNESQEGNNKKVIQDNDSLEDVASDTSKSEVIEVEVINEADTPTMELLPVSSSAHPEFSISSAVIPASEVDGTKANIIMDSICVSTDSNPFLAAPGGWAAVNKMTQQLLRAGFSPIEVQYGLMNTRAFALNAIRFTIMEAKEGEKMKTNRGKMIEFIATAIEHEVYKGD